MALWTEPVVRQVMVTRFARRTVVDIKLKGLWCSGTIRSNWLCIKPTLTMTGIISTTCISQSVRTGPRTLSMWFKQSQTKSKKNQSKYDCQSLSFFSFLDQAPFCQPASF